MAFKSKDWLRETDFRDGTIGGGGPDGALAVAKAWRDDILRTAFQVSRHEAGTAEHAQV